MKKLVVLGLMLLPLTLFAQEVKIAIVNTSEIVSQMPEVSEMERKIADLNAQYEKEFKIMQDEYTKKYSEYVAQQDSLTENIKLRRQQDLQDLEMRIQNYVPEAQQAMQKQQETLFAPIQEKLQNAIKAVGDEKGYTYILNPQALLYRSNNAVDATSFVKEKLGIR
ncbi:MAG: OmpH family outer membrane protein [Tannerella sp.]|jgi:outer membrane protein|nr:OmpH family outer membrane protein [Tannerella sp.]